MFFLRKDRGSGTKTDCRPDGVYICDECIGICSEIMEEEFAMSSGKIPVKINLMKPKEIKEFLDEVRDRTG